MQTTINILRASMLKAFDSHGHRLYDDREIRSIIDLILEDECGLTRTDRILHPDFVIADAQRIRLAEVARQLEAGVPVQQALGRAWFCDRYFRVSPDVLVPRPETAELVTWIVDNAVDNSNPLRILDIGTGSGCIAVTLARLINSSQVLAMDLSTAAIHIAEDNARQQGVDNLQFIQCDILKAVENPSASDPLSTSYQQPLDIIVSNPPYICQQEAVDMSELVLLHEPSLALFVPDDDPLLFYRAIARYGMTHLRKGGQLYFEINAAYGPQTCQLLRDLGYTDVELRQDVNGRDRMVKATHSTL